MLSSYIDILDQSVGLTDIANTKATWMSLNVNVGYSHWSSDSKKSRNNLLDISESYNHYTMALSTLFWRQSERLSNHHWTLAQFFCPVFTIDKDANERGSFWENLETAASPFIDPFNQLAREQALE